MTDQKQCQNCEKLQKELEDLTEFINALGDDIYLKGVDAANEIERGDVPRGRYEYLLAQWETCNDILTMMNKPTVTKPGGSKGYRGTGLFSGLFGGMKL